MCLYRGGLVAGCLHHTQPARGANNIVRVVWTRRCPAKCNDSTGFPRLLPGSEGQHLALPFSTVPYSIDMGKAAGNLA